MDTATHVFFQFELEHLAVPDGWDHVERRDAPDDTVWKRSEGRRGVTCTPFPDPSGMLGF